MQPNSIARANSAPKKRSNSRRTFRSRRIKEFTGGGGASVTVDAIATAPTTQAGLIAAPGWPARASRIDLTGRAAQIPIPADQLVQAELEIVGSASNPHRLLHEIFDLIAPREDRSGRADLAPHPLSHPGVFHDFDTYATKGLERRNDVSVTPSGGLVDLVAAVAADDPERVAIASTDDRRRRCATAT